MINVGKLCKKCVIVMDKRVSRRVEIEDFFEEILGLEREIL